MKGILEGGSCVYFKVVQPKLEQILCHNEQKKANF